jgi:hypothetical protein
MVDNAGNKEIIMEMKNMSVLQKLQTFIEFAYNK